MGIFRTRFTSGEVSPGHRCSLPTSSPKPERMIKVLRTLPATVRDLNESWYERCLLWLEKGLTMLADAQLAETHTTAKADVDTYVALHKTDRTLGGRLILDAVTMHDSELARVTRTLRAV